jgi:hypothetical protein
MKECTMFRENKKHLQNALISTLDELQPKNLERLRQSWAGTFYQEFFSRLDERPFAALFSDVDSRPNIPINVLLGLEALKAGFGWSDESLWDHFCFDLQVRFALGYRNLGEGQFALRTVYNFRARLLRHMQETGEDLLSRAFAQVTDDQAKAIGLNTTHVRMDSTMIASNIRNLSRLELLVVVLQHVHRMLSANDRASYETALAPYMKGSSKQYVYRVNKQEGPERIMAIGLLMQCLVTELEPLYAQDPTYQILLRVFQEHFAVDPEGVRAKQGKELSASSLASPDDLDASFRRKCGVGYKGYSANVSETCAPENATQLVVMVQTAPNTANDDDLMMEALPALKQRLDIQELYTDGGYNSMESYEACRDLDIEHIQTAIRGHAPSVYTGLDGFDITTSPAGIPQTVVCPQGQQAVVQQARELEHYAAHFPADVCATCPERERCRTRTTRTSYRSLLFDAHDLEIARRRQRIARDRLEGRNPRAAVESTIASLKRPFGSKLPVRSRFRIHGWLVCASFMINVRRLHRYLGGGSPAEAPAMALGQETGCKATFFSFLRRALMLKLLQFPAGTTCLASLA